MTASTNPLVSVEELAAGSPAPTLLDVRWKLSAPRAAADDADAAGAPAFPPRPSGLDDYLAGHLPGARFVDLDTELAGPVGPGTGRHPLPDVAAFQAAMRAAGVDDGTPVVVYDAADSTAAARAWWLLRYFGHRDVRVLDGGYAAWRAAGLPVSDSPEPAGAGDFTAEPGQLPTLGAAEAGRLAGTGILLDARAGARYRGEVEPIDPVAGHIPGAISAPTIENVAEDGRFHPAGDLAARFAAQGVRPPDPSAGPGPVQPEVGVYCGSGVTAAHQILALTIARIPAALYVGSWSEWITDPGRPVAKGIEG
jgi:thiosulfate/3-mercaptopyruvate sulfurtransferase